MRNVRTAVISTIVVLVWSASAHATGILTAERKAAVEQEVRDTLSAEQQAMATRGCDGALAFFADREPLFVANGRTMPTKQSVQSTCSGKVPDPSWRELQHHAVRIVSETTAYSVSNYRAKSGAIQVVTKIWEKGNDGWRIVHAHESVAVR